MFNKRTIALIAVSTVAISAIVVTDGIAVRPIPVVSWNARAAATYLDQRQGWWESWPKSARDHGTVCVSCHTAVPYALARPELDAALQERDVPPMERKLFDDVVTRVRAWNEVKPFYGDSTPKGLTKAIESRGTESVLNALILASRDERAGAVSPEARQAFANMFALQHTSGDDAGTWSWLNFSLRPWESTTSPYFGAALAAIAIGMEPQNYASSREIQPNVARLRAYLRDRVDQSLWTRLLRRDDSGLFNRAMLLWASAKLPGLITNEEQRSLIAALEDAQARDGSWRLTSLGSWSHLDEASPDTTGDGYATGLVAYALEQAGAQPNEPHLARALAWLAQHQDPSTGMWHAWSLNKRRDPASNVGKFMSDAATAYAVMALTEPTTSRAGRTGRDNKPAVGLRASLRAPLRQ